MVPLYQRSDIIGASVEKEVGEMVISTNTVEVTYDSRDGELFESISISDLGHVDLLGEHMRFSRLWLSEEGVIWINCKENLVSAEFKKGSRPIYMIFHPTDLSEALDELFS